MKKRLLITLLTICTVISITIGIASFSYAWLNKEPVYSFTLSTGDYPLLVNTNIYIPKFNYSEKAESVYDSSSSSFVDGNLGYEYGDSDGNVLKLEKNTGKDFNYKANTLDIKTGQMNPNVNGDESTNINKPVKGHVEINFPTLTSNIIDYSYQKLSMIGNSDNNYALNAKYFYCAFIEFLYLKQFFNAYLICIPHVVITGPDGVDLNDLIQFTFMDSDQNGPSFNYDNSKSTYLSVDSETGVVTTNGLNNQTENDIFYDYTSVTDRTRRTPTSTIQPIYVTTDEGATYSGREIAALSRVDGTTNANCYSYATVYGIYLNPVKLFDLIKQNKVTDLNFTLTLDFDFYLSDNNITNKDVAEIEGTEA